jgi:hypothetical protein
MASVQTPLRPPPPLPVPPPIATRNKPSTAWVSAAGSTAAGATLAVGGNFGNDIAEATGWAAVLALMTVLGAAEIAVATYWGRSRASR